MRLNENHMRLNLNHPPMKYIAIFVATLLLVACGQDELSEKPLSTTNKIIIEDVSYGSDPLQKMDIFLPLNRTSNSKAVIFIHGGGWVAGDKSETFNLQNYLCDNGFASASINYRFADATKGINHVSLLSDIKEAIGYLHRKANYHGCSFSKLTLFGGSAGAHLSLLYAYSYDLDNNVEKVVSLAGPTNLTDSLFRTIPTVNETIYNLTGTNDLLVWKAASPIHYEKSTQTLLYHGKLDTIVPYQQATQLYDKIKDLNPGNQLVLFDDCGHGFNEAAYLQIVDDVFFGQ